MIPVVFQVGGGPGWVCPQFRDCFDLVWSMSAGWVWGWGCLAPAVPVSCQREGKGSCSGGPASAPLPGICGFAGAGFMTAALLSPRGVGFGKQGAKRRSGSGQGKVGTLAAASTGTGLALMCNHGALCTLCSPSWVELQACLAMNEHSPRRGCFTGLYSL